MNNNSQVWNYIIEFFKRLGAKTPTFFKVLNYLSIATVIVTGLPGVLEELGITLPAWAEVLQSKAAAIAAIISTILTKLPTETPVVGTSAGGTPLKATNPETLPFTVKSEANAEAAKTNP